MSTDFQPSEPTVQERLRRAVVNHQAAEEPSIELYRDAISETTNPMIKLVLEAILQDEERHHEAMSQIAIRLTSNKPSEGSIGADLTASKLAELIEHEQTGSTRLHSLAEAYKEVDGGFPSLLLDAMATDSERHEKMLQYIASKV